MNRVKYVPADPRAREQNRKSLFVLKVFEGGKPWVTRGHLTTAEADRAAYAKGWVRLSTLPPGERAKYRA